MNREILFRGKRIDNGEWVEGSFVMDATELLQRERRTADPILADGFIRRYDFQNHKVEMFEVERETIGQCTGLTDKNGKKIFEGDCLRLSSETTGMEGDGVCVVRFGRFRDTDALADFDHLGWYITISTIPNEATTIYALEENDIAFEVIGNIHDNPELLEG